MKHTYTIKGMTCDGCGKSIEIALNNLEDVMVANINLEKGEAEITMKRHISTHTLQEVISEKGAYSIELKENVNAGVSNFEINEKSDLLKLLPLFLIFGYITGASILLNIKPEFSVSDFMLDFMGLFYIVFSFFKFLDLKGFPDTFRMYDPLAKVLPVYGWAYPFIELALGIMFLMRFQIGIALIATLIILGITTLGVTRVLLDKKSIQCACLGTALKLPMTKATFIENTIMLVMAIWMIINLYK